MAKSSSLATRVYAALNHLYPPSFREEFADEMQGVFVDAITEARKRGIVTSLVVVFRELRDLPVSLVREYRYVIAHMEGFMQETKGANSVTKYIASEEKLDQYQAPWWQAVLAGLPHLLYPLSIEIPSLVRVLYSGTVRIYYLNEVFWVLVVVALVFGWRRKWPRWSASWVGYGLVMAFEFMINTYQTYYGSLLENIVVLIWLVMTAAVFFWMARRDWLSGILVILPVAPMFFTYIGLDGVKGTVPEGLYFMAVGLLMMVVVMAIVRTGNLRASIWLVLAAFIVISLPVSYATTYYSNRPPQSAFEPSLSNVVSSFLIHLLVFLIFAAPLWLLALWTWGRRRITRNRVV